MFEPVTPSETVASDQSPPVAAGRPCDLIVDGTRIWLDGDIERTTTTGEATIDVDIAPVLEVLRSEMSPNPFDGIDSDELTETALTLAALEAGVRVEQLKLLAELDARDAWKTDGQTGMVAWMGLAFGTRVHTARQMLGVARTMGALPAILAAYTEGRIGWDRPDGTTLGIGRASKVWPAWVARIIRERDGNRCRFPGCRGPIHHVHHINEWVADQGETNSSNGMGGCFTHHHLVHEGGWTVTGDANRELTFTSPDGTRTLTSRPAHLTPQLKKRLARCSTTNFDDLD